MQRRLCQRVLRCFFLCEKVVVEFDFHSFLLAHLEKMVIFAPQNKQFKQKNGRLSRGDL